MDDLLDTAHRLLPEGGRVGLLLASYSLQTQDRACRYNQNWSLQAEMLPRTLFPGLKHPLSFVLFSKDQRRIMTGMALYHEAVDVASMPDRVAEMLRLNPKTWIAVVRDALDRLGGRARLEDIYAEVAPRRPTGNPAWKEQVRKVAARHFPRVALAEYALAA
ncbi:class I SAM-dependent methyltransferase [Sinimarinibacterium sp. CAU 1509]|uniref:class I SAM-dependent methyltransferase n=1 Tax=Sinimarinibacterium sp. CAU 1509 TaxID=2562283 RepID=UPI0010ACE202|nr:class I SAM-dependent methyltransferase [Sinimarinibacterium sp. CAU 1509]TJY57166.1 class I SAM-dependent methyltransferase [Sinimarinibacterium sp. CAU 1509]